MTNKLDNDYWARIYEGQELRYYQDVINSQPNNKNNNIQPIVLDTKPDFSRKGISLDQFGPVLLLFKIGTDVFSSIRKNKASHVGNEKISGDYKTINPDPKKMGFLERWWIRPLQKEQVCINGVNLEITYHKRTAGRSSAEITGGPPQLVGSEVSNLSRQSDWKEKANNALAGKVNNYVKEQEKKKFPGFARTEFKSTPKQNDEPEEKSKVQPNKSSEPQNKPKDQAPKQNPKDLPEKQTEAPPEPETSDESNLPIPIDPQKDPKNQSPKTLTGRVMDLADKASQAGKEQAEFGRSLIKESNDNRQIANKNKAKMEKVGQTAEKIEKYKQKHDAYNKKANQQRKEGYKDAVIGRAKEKGAAEAKNQLGQIKDTAKNGAALNAIDAVFDYGEGKCDASTAVKNTVTNTITGTATQVGGSVAYEAAKGALLETCPKVVEYVPGFDTVMTVYNVSSAYQKDGLWGVGDFGGEMATTAAVGAILTATGVGAPVVAGAIGGKIIWRGMKYGYAYFSAPSTNAAVQAVGIVKQS